MHVKMNDIDVDQICNVIATKYNIMGQNQVCIFVY